MRVPDGRVKTRSTETSRARAWAAPRSVAAVAALWLAAGCTPPPKPPPAPVQLQSPRDEILHVGHVWENDERDRGFRSAPSVIASFTSRTVTRLELPEEGNKAVEHVHVVEDLGLRSGQRFHCEASGQRPVTIAFATRRQTGEAAMELAEPALILGRVCTPGGFPEPTLTLRERKTRFALGADRLVAYEPAVDRREFIPTE